MTIGILITYWNERELLTECLKSIGQQVDRVDEVLVYDDASDYPAKDYLPPGSMTRVIRGDRNRGPSYGRNALLAASRSEYVHFHDADDLISSGWCARLRAELAASNVDVVFNEVSFFENESSVWRESVLGLEALMGRSEDLVRFALQGSILAAAGTYRREVVLRIGGYRQELWQSEDFDFHVRLAASGVAFRVIPEALIFCRSREGSRSGNRIEVYLCALEAIQMLARELPSRYFPDLADAAARFGSDLFRLGERRAARTAFDMATRIGPPAFRHQRYIYRLLARLGGAELAELSSAWYRRFVPHGARRLLRLVR